MDLKTMTIADARKALHAKECSSLELTDAYLENIATRDPDIHAYLQVWKKEARDEAKAADEILARGDGKPLTGIPIAIKDNILIEGRRVSAGSKILENYLASYDATVIARLKSQSVVFLGNTNMDEFALGSSTENSAYGPTKNPHDTSRVPGGTSGGSAAAVAGNMALAALGSDTGGSIRQPAAFCGVVGLKPTYGSVSRYGLIAAASSLDQIGPIGKNVADVKMLFDVIRGYDASDSTSLPAGRQVSLQSPRSDLSYLKGQTLKIGVPRAFLNEGMEADILSQFESTLRTLERAGYSIVAIELPALEYALAVYYIINPAEVSTNLARFDGMRYGLSVPADSIAEVYSKTRAQGFGAETRRRIMVGTFVLSAGYADAYYRKARVVRQLIRDDFARVFEEVDAIALPVSPIAPWKFGEKADPVAMYAADIFTVPVNLAGTPAISVPAGTVSRDGTNLPVGFQIMASQEREEVLFAIGADVERISS